MIKTQNLAYNPTPPLLTLPTQHTTATHPDPSPTHYHTPPATQYLTTHQTTVPLYPNPPPLHAIPYPTSLPSTATQSLHPPQTSALAPQTHYPTFSSIVIPPQSHSPHLNTQNGYQWTTQRGTTANDHIFYGKWCTMYYNNWTTWCLWWVQLQLPGANQFVLKNQLQHPGTQHKETKARSTIMGVAGGGDGGTCPPTFWKVWDRVSFVPPTFWNIFIRSI